jgi:phospholipid/cholesterol/gamma-HCH transport system ATP-binding protein
MKFAAPTPAAHTAENARSAHAVEIQVENVHRAFAENRVLRGVSLEIRRGELIAIVGGSGCGKTVLLEHMIGNLTPDSGRVLIADHESPGSPLQDLAELSSDGMDRLRRHWAIVFQRNALFSGSVYDNIALWLREVKQFDEAEISRRVHAAIESVGLAPDVLSRLRGDLSGGMGKRVAIARAIAMEPLLMFYDEPTAGLDPHHSALIHRLIGSTHGNLGPGLRTSVIITHDRDLLARLTPRVIMLHEGRVAFDGSFSDFLASDSPITIPYFEQMPGIQQTRGAQ